MYSSPSHFGLAFRLLAPGVVMESPFPWGPGTFTVHTYRPAPPL
jgi:hypothetical protein